MHRHVTFQDGGTQEIQWSKDEIAWRELYKENYQIWAADVDTSQRELLFEMNKIIVGQPCSLFHLHVTSM